MVNDELLFWTQSRSDGSLKLDVAFSGSYMFIGLWPQIGNLSQLI